MKQKNGFSGQIGFVFAAAGSAVGVGNLWRFPYLAAKDGGGLFLILYLVLVLTVGFTLLTTDIAIGRKTGKSAIYAYEAMRKKWKFLGVLTFLVPILIMTYYAVIGGWILKYITIYLLGSGEQAVDSNCFSNFISAPSSVWYSIAFMLLTSFIVYNGVEKGIERVSKFIMPVLLLMVVGIAVFSLTLKTTLEDGTVRTGLQGLAVYLTPDLSGITLERFLQIALDAMSQLFFSLSVSMGIMITYGSYVKKDVDLNKSVSQIELMDTGVAFLAGVMIIPAVFVFSGLEGMSAGPGTHVCVSAEGIFLHGICWKDDRNPLFYAGGIRGTDVLHLGSRIHYGKLYGVVPFRAEKDNGDPVRGLSDRDCGDRTWIQCVLCGGKTAERKYRAAVGYHGLYQQQFPDAVYRAAVLHFYRMGDEAGVDRGGNGIKWRKVPAEKAL